MTPKPKSNSVNLSAEKVNKCPFQVSYSNSDGSFNDDHRGESSTCDPPKIMKPVKITNIASDAESFDMLHKAPTNVSILMIKLNESTALDKRLSIEPTNRM